MFIQLSMSAKNCLVGEVVVAQLAEQSVASNTIGPRFESSHRQNFIFNIFRYC